MKIEDILDPRCVKVPIGGTGKEQVIGQLIDLMVKAGVAENSQELLAAALEREGLMSTGIGKGVAIPHGRSKGVKRMAGSFGSASRAAAFRASRSGIGT